MAKALIIGVGLYPFRKFSIHGDEDAVYFGNKLVSLRPTLFSQDNTRLLLNERATSAAIFERLDWLFKNSAPNETLVLYFSGGSSLVAERDQATGKIDGQSEPCIVPYDVEDTKAIPLSNFLSVLKAANARLVVILDTAFEYLETYVKPEIGLSMATSRFLDSAQSKVIAPPLDVAFRRIDQPWSRVSLRMPRKGVLFYPGGEAPTLSPIVCPSTRSGSMFTELFCDSWEVDKDSKYMDLYNTFVAKTTKIPVTFTPRVAFGSEEMRQAIAFK